MRPTATMLGILVVLMTASGATCWPRHGDVPMPPTVAFDAPPTLQDIIIAVNTNSEPVRQLQTENARLRVPGLPALKARIAVDRPRRFRMVAELFQFTGTEIDLGSNDRLFWMWVRRNPQPGIYYCGHDQYEGSKLRQILPIQPHWLIEALGAVHLDPKGNHEGPYASGKDRVWLRTRVPSPGGDMTKITVVHDTYGWVLEQFVYDSRGALIASSQASKHRHYKELGVTLPHHIDIQLAPGQPMQMAFQLDVDSYSLNNLYGDPQRLWEIPRYEGHPPINVADPRWRPPWVK